MNIHQFLEGRRGLLDSQLGGIPVYSRATRKPDLGGSASMQVTSKNPSETGNNILAQPQNQRSQTEFIRFHPFCHGCTRCVSAFLSFFRKLISFALVYYHNQFTSPPPRTTRTKYISKSLPSLPWSSEPRSHLTGSAKDGSRRCQRTLVPSVYLSLIPVADLLPTGDGGAYPECHVAQYPLNLGKKKVCPVFPSADFPLNHLPDASRKYTCPPSRFRG